MRRLAGILIENGEQLFRDMLSTMIPSRCIAHGLYVFVLPHDLIQKICNVLGAFPKLRVNTSDFTGDFSLKKEKIGASNHTSNRRLDLVERHAAHHETKAFCLNTGAFAV